MPSKYQRAASSLRELPGDVILNAARLCNGHNIIKPQALLGAGLPADVVEQVTVTHQSDGTPKGTLYVDGQPVKQVAGVYGLDMLEFMASALGVKYRQCMGRGFQASAIREALNQHVNASES